LVISLHRFARGITGYILIGQGISLIGTWMQHNMHSSWLVYDLTGSVFLLGLVAFTSQIPTFVLSPYTGC
jgi:hypothetical protein